MTAGSDERHRFETPVDLARDLHLLTVELHFGRERSLGPADQCSEHLAGLVGVVVDRLLAEEHELRLLLLNERLE